MRAKCIQDCFDGPRAWQYKTDGGEKGDGFYEGIDPSDPIAKYFEFPDEKINTEIAKTAQEQESDRAKKAAEKKDKKSK
jgi:hypothetical protein